METQALPQQQKSRRLKVERDGDFCLQKTKPYLRLRGVWLRNAGFPEDSHVEITIPQPGTLIIQAETQPTVNPTDLPVI